MINDIGIMKRIDGMNDWKIGDKVICINDNIDDFTNYQIAKSLNVNLKLDLHGLIKGKIYTISGFEEPRSFTKSKLCIILKEIKRPKITQGFAVERFRKVQPKKTDISIFTNMLKSKEKVC